MDGGGVAPASINASDLTTINKKYGRKVYLWWNYPVNDVLADHLNMAPCRGLDKKLAEAVSGFVANPMNRGHASLYPLFTVADYLWNPTAYDADRSARAAATYLAGNAADAAMTFIDLCRRLPAERECLDRTARKADRRMARRIRTDRADPNAFAQNGG